MANTEKNNREKVVYPSVGIKGIISVNGTEAVVLLTEDSPADVKKTDLLLLMLDKRELYAMVFKVDGQEVTVKVMNEETGLDNALKVMLEEKRRILIYRNVHSENKYLPLEA